MITTLLTHELYFLIDFSRDTVPLIVGWKGSFSQSVAASIKGGCSMNGP